MIRIPGQPGRDLCDSHLGITRRDLLRVGGSALMGLTLGSVFSLQAKAKAAAAATGANFGKGFGKAKHVVMIYMQGGPSHLDLWDPKENLPDKMRSPFKSIPTRIPGVHFTEVLPELAKLNDKFSMIRSMSYTPNGLFNHTAAIYQIMTGYTTDKVSPSGQLEPPSPKDYPNFGSNIIRLKPPTEPMLPFVMLPRPLQESNVVGKGGTAGIPRQGVRSVHAFPRRRRPRSDEDEPREGGRSEAAARCFRHAPPASRGCARRSRIRCRTSTRRSRATTSTNITTRR